MNEEAIQHAYDLFTNDGYTKSVDEFKTLMSSNPDALAHSYGLFQSDGYSKSLEEFQALMAGTQQEEVKKKDSSTDATLPTEGGESVSGGSDLLDTSIQDREAQGHQTDISLFTDGSDKDAVAAAAEQERGIFYEEQGLDFKNINELKKRREELEEEKSAYQEDVLNTKFELNGGIKRDDKFFVPKDKGFFESQKTIEEGGYDEVTKDKALEFATGATAVNVAMTIGDYVLPGGGSEGGRSERSILDDIGSVEEELNESRPQVIKAEEAYNTQITNSFLEQGYRGDRLTQLMENADIKQEYVESKLITINGQESTGVTVEEGIYDDEFISGLQDGSIKVEVHPSIKDTDYGRYLENAIAVQSNAGGEFGDIKDALMSGGFGTVAGTLEVLESVEAVGDLGYGDEGGILAREVKDKKDQVDMMQRMYQYPGFMQSMRAGEFSDAAFQLGRGIAGSTVQIAISAIGARLAIPQPYLMGFIAVSAAGQKSLSLKEQRREGNLDMSDFALATNALLSGVAEAAWEIPTFQIIEGIKNITKGAGKAAVRDVTKRAVDGLLKDLLKEGGSEAGTTVTEMIVDHVTGAGTPESFDEIVNEVGNAFVTGVGMAGGMRAVGGSAAVTSSVINKLTGVDLTNRIVATIKTVNKDGSLGDKQELTQAEYRKWRKDPKNLKAQLEGGVNVEVFNKDIEGDLQDLVDSASEDVVDANESVDVVGREANSEINELGNDLKDKDSAPSEGRVSKIAQLLNKMGSLIDGSSSNRGVDLKALKANFNAIMSKAGFSVNDNVTNQNTDNANIESTENITEIQSKEQANAIEKALDEGGDLSVVLSQDGVGVSKSGESVSKNNIKLGKFKSKAAAKKALDAFNKKNSKAEQKQKRHVEVQKKNNKEFKAADKGKMDDVSQEDLDGDFNVMSAELDGLDAATNDKRTDNLEKVLKNKGLKYKKVTTIENGVSKTSFMVEGVESNEALSIASGFGQKSITSSKDGVLHSDGTVEALDGNTYDGPDARDGARVIVIKQNGKKKAIRLGTGKKSFAKKFNSNNIADIAKFVEYLPDNQKKILGHVLNFFSKIQGLNIGIVKNTYAMKQQLEADGYSPEDINKYAKNRAIYRGSDGTMYLNLEVMNMNTPFHEIIHPLVNFIKKTDSETRNKAIKEIEESQAYKDADTEGKKQMIDAIPEGVYSKIEDMVSKSEPGMIGSPFRKRWIDSNGRRQSGSYLDWVKGQDAYEDLSRQDQIEEAFAEMMGDAAANQFQKDNSKLKQIYDAIREMLSVFNINIPADKNLASLDLSDLQNIGDLRSGIGSALAKGTSLNVGGVDFTVSKTEGEIKGQASDLLSEKENLADFGLDSEKRNTLRTLGAALDARQRKKYKVINKGTTTDKASDYISDFIKDEVIYSIDNIEDSGLGWYEEKYQRALNNLAEVNDFMKEGEPSRDLFTMLLAITSDGIEVSKNLEFAETLTKEYVETGSIDSSKIKFGGKSRKSMVTNVNNIIDLLNQFDGDMAKVKEFLTVEKSVSEFKKDYPEIVEKSNYEQTGAPADKIKLPMAAMIFGPKLGAFYGNLTGGAGYLTMDRWFSRTFNRYRGIVKTPLGKERYDRAREAILKLKGLEKKYNLDYGIKLSSSKNLSKDKVVSTAKKIASLYVKNNKRRDSLPEELKDNESLLNSFSKDYGGLQDSPFGKADRTFMYEAVWKAQEKLAKEGRDVTVADIQAILWYFEKSLYKKFKVQGPPIISYEEATERAIPDFKAQAPDNDGFTGGRSQYARFNVIPNTDRANALIEDLSEDRVSEIAMKGNWSIITGTVEAEGKYNNEANVSNNAKLYKELVEEFGTKNIEVVQGVYMKKDQGPSLFVTGITEHRAMQIGKDFSQEGVLTRRGNIFTDGSGMNPASETVFVGDNALNKDGNSTTTSGVTFSLDVDWGTKVPLATGIKAQAMDNMEYTSNALTSLKAINIDKANATEWISKLSKGVKGTSKDIATMGLEDILKAYQKESKVKSIPKEVVARLIATNMADIETFILDDTIDPELNERLSKTKTQDIPMSDVAKVTSPKYPEYTLPGGENYREFLIRDKSSEDIFTATHYDDLGENLIASVRADDRVGPNGEKVLFVQEIQSDWVQGTNKGDFATKDEVKELESQKNSFFQKEAKVESEKRKLANLKDSKINGVVGTNGLIVKYKRLRDEGNDGSMSAEEYKEVYKEVYVDTNSDGITIADEMIQEYEEQNAAEVIAIKNIQDEISALDDVLYSSYAKRNETTEKLDGLKPYLPWNQTDLWVGLAIRKVINQASKEGYDQIAFVNGEQSDIVQSHTGDNKGTTHKFYNTVVPPQINKELTRLVKGMRYGVGNIEGITDVRGKKVDQAVINLTPELKAATDKVGPLRFQAGNGITEDQLTVLKSTYSDIEKKHPNINVDEGMIKLYHYSDERLNTVDPRIASRQTYSNQEYRTWGRSRVFFYTDADMKEGVVGGSVMNETLLPIDRVYPLTEDPLNLEEVVKNNLDAKRNSGDKTQSTITLNTKSMDSSVLAISKLKSLLKDMGLSDVVDFGDVTENFTYNKDDSGKYQRAGIKDLSFTVNYPIDSDNITSVIKDTFDKASFEKVDPATLPFNYFEEMANVAEGLGFQGFIYDHVGGKTVSSWKPVSVVGDRFQAASQEDTDVYVSGLGAIMWDLAKPIIDADYELGGWMSNVRKPSRRYKKEDSEGKMVSTVRATELFGRPKGLHTNQEIKEMIIAGRAQLNHQLYVANKNQKNLKKVIEAEEKRIKSEDSYKNATPEQQEAMLEHLTPEALNNTMSSIDAIQLLPEQSKLREAMTTVRNHIDVLSMTMYEEGLVSGPMRYTIEGNLGYYLTRSYKQYEDSDWRQDNQEVIRRAEVFVMNKLMAEPKNMSKEDAEVLAGQMVKDLVNSKDKDSGMRFMKNSGISGSLHRVGSIFEKRNEALPKEIRELLGERMDPLTNYVNTISKLSRTLISNQMYEDMIDFGMGKFISEPNPNDPDYSAIPDIGNKLEGKKWGPLDGKFVDNEMLDVLKFYDEGDAEMGLATKAWMTFVYGTKKAATVYNPATHAVNLFGNSYFSLMNGHTSPAKFFESFRVAAGQITNLNGQERQAFYEELVSLGVVDSSASLAEVVQIGEDLIQGVDMNKIMDKLGDRMAGKSAKFLLAAAGKADKAATKSYQAEDDLFKIFGYMSEKAKYMEAGLSEKEAKARAVRNTGNTYPNYGRVPAVVRAIGRNPFVGTFVSFTAESIRCTKNAIQLSFDEMGDPNPKIKKMGAKRLAASLLTLKFAESLTSAGISMMFGAFGDDEEEFHKELFGLRHLDAPWNKDSNIAPINKGFFERGVDGFTEENNGHAFVEYMNTSRLSGGGFVKDLLRIAFTDMNTPDYDSTLSRILYKFYGSFLSEDMALGVVRDVIDNKGNKVFNATENLGWNIYDIFKYTVGKLGPGAFKSISRIEESMREDSKRTTTNEVRAMIGLRTTTLDVNDALFFKSREIIKDMRDRSESLEFDLRQKDMTLAYTLNPSHEMFDKKMSQYFNGLVSAVQTARRLGVNISGTKDNCIDMLKKANVPQEVIDRVIRAALNGEGSETLRIGDK